MKFPAAEQWLYLCNMLLSRLVNAGKKPEQLQPETILCIKWDEIGDLATCTNVFALLRQRYPKAVIHVITKPYCAGLIASDPNVNEVFDSTASWNRRYDLVVELRGTWSTLWKVFRYWPKMRFDRGTVRARQRGRQPHESLTNYRIVEPLLGGIQNQRPQVYPSAKSVAKISSYLQEYGLTRYCVIHAGARRELRRWNDAGFAALADWLVSEKGFQVVFAGTESEEAQLQRIVALMKQPYLLQTRDFSLSDLAALLAKASLFVGNESGPLHIADDLNVPLVGLYGPGVTTVFYPQHPKSGVVHHVLECNPCDQLHCVHPENPCMNRISLEEVKLNVEQVLA